MDAIKAQNQINDKISRNTEKIYRTIQESKTQRELKRHDTIDNISEKKKEFQTGAGKVQETMNKEIKKMFDLRMQSLLLNQKSNTSKFSLKSSKASTIIEKPEPAEIYDVKPENFDKYIELGPKLTNMNDFVQKFLIDNQNLNLDYDTKKMLGFNSLSKKFSRYQSNKRNSKQQQLQTFPQIDQKQLSNNRSQSVLRSGGNKINLLRNMATIDARPYQNNTQQALKNYDANSYRTLEKVLKMKDNLMDHSKPGQLKKRDKPAPEYEELFPLQKIEIWNANDHVDDKFKLDIGNEFNTKIKQEAEKKYIKTAKYFTGEGQDYEQYKKNVTGSDRKLIENELMLNAKLMRINSLMMAYFNGSQQAESTFMPVKVQDASELPSVYKAGKLAKKGKIVKKQSSQLFTAPPVPTEHQNLLNDIKKGKIELSDHNQVVFTQSGTRFDDLAKKAVPEDQATQLFNFQRKKTIQMLNDGNKIQHHELDDSDQEFWDDVNHFCDIDMTKLHSIVNKKRKEGRTTSLSKELIGKFLQFQNGKNKKVAQQFDDSVTLRFDSLIPSQVRELLEGNQKQNNIYDPRFVDKINRDYQEYQPKLLGQTHKQDKIETDNLPYKQAPQIQHLIYELRQLYIIKSQVKNSYKFARQFERFQRKLKLQNELITGKESGIKGLDQTLAEFFKGIAADDRSDDATIKGDLSTLPSRSNLDKTQTSFTASAKVTEFGETFVNFNEQVRKRYQKSKKDDLFNKLVSQTIEDQDKDQQEQEDQKKQDLKERLKAKDFSNQLDRLRDPLKEKRTVQMHPVETKYLKKQKNILEDEKAQQLMDVDHEMKKHDITQERQLIMAQMIGNTKRLVEREQNRIEEIEKKNNKKNYVNSNLLKDIMGYQKLYDTMNGLQGTLISKKQANEDVQIDSDDDTKELAEEMASYTKKKGLKTKEQKEAEQASLTAFLQECQHLNINPKDVLKNLKNKQLKYVNIKLDVEFQRALFKFIKKATQGGLVLDSFCFAKNDFSNEEQLAKLIQPFTTPSCRTKSAIIVENTIGEQTAQILSQIITDVKKPLMQEFIINETRLLSYDYLTGLLNDLTMHCSSKLQILGLAEQMLSNSVSKQLSDLILNSQALKNLDISMTKYSQRKNLEEVLIAIKDNNSALEFLNLGGITFPQWTHDLKETDKFVMEPSFEALTTIIKEAKRLTHLNIAQCFSYLQVQLNSYAPCQLTLLFESFKRSKTLQSVHYSGNFLSKHSLQHIEDLLGIVPHNGYGSKTTQPGQDAFEDAFGDLNDKMDIKSIREMINDYNYVDDLEEASPLIKKTTKIRSLQKDLNTVIEEQEQNYYKRNVELKTKFIGKLDHDRASNLALSLETCSFEQTIPKGDKIIFSRFLGHREIADGHKWQYRSECWMCDQWKYTLFIWSQKLAKLSYSKTEQLFVKKDKKLIRQWHQLKKRNKQFDENYSDAKAPRIFGPGTNFVTKQMIPMPIFLDHLHHNNESWLRFYDEDTEFDKLLERKQNLNRVITDEENFMVNREWIQDMLLYLRQDDKQSYIDLRQLSKMDLDYNDKYYCYANFYPPMPKEIQLGVQSASDAKTVSLIKQKFGERELKYCVKYKCIKKKRLQRKFNIANSLFNSWKVNLQEHYRKCLLADMTYSKIHKFVKDPVEKKNIEKVLIDYFRLIFEQYVFGQGISNYPTVGMNHFARMCTNWGIIGSNPKTDLTTSDVDRLFVAVNFEEVQGQSVELDDNPDKELCRYEFFEITVRLAKEKYIDKKKTGMSISEATKKLLEDYLVKYKLKQTYMDLREQNIWTLEVHDVLEANQQSLKIFYEWWIKNFSSKKSRKFMHFEEAWLMMRQVPRPRVPGGIQEKTAKDEANLNEQTVNLCFANSKFILIDEMTAGDKLYSLKYDEFLEYVVRMAYLASFDITDEDENTNEEDEDEAKAGSGQMLIEDKVFEMIDLILRIMKDPKSNLRAVRPDVQGLGDSESDYD